VTDKTGFAPGTLSPVIYFHNRRKNTISDGKVIVHLSHGHFVLPPVEMGQGPGLARMIWERRYKEQGYEWCEASTLSDVDELQSRLIEQESRILEAQGQMLDNVREASRKATASNLRQRMVSSSCGPFEREFIQLWLSMDEEKRKKYTQRFTERNMFLWAAAMDSGNNRVEDRMGE